MKTAKMFVFMLCCFLQLGCVFETNTLIPDEAELKHCENLVNIMIHLPEDDVSLGAKNEILHYASRSMASLQCPDINLFASNFVERTFSEAVVNGGIDQEWLARFMVMIREAKPTAVVKTSPRKGLVIVPDPSVHITVRIDRKERDYIIAPGFFGQILCGSDR